MKNINFEIMKNISFELFHEIAVLYGDVLPIINTLYLKEVDTVHECTIAMIRNLLKNT
jgi:hypothetical protein